MSSPEQVIERIRKIRFGIGLDTSNLSIDQIDALEDKARVLEDASRLAREINTKRPHFVLELIQNAEDNYYEEGISPRIRFVINQNELIVQNNESGFEEKNVWALCGIGETTKRDKSMGYVGEKGIGFKSVFMITESPHVFSKGFQFKFEYEKDNPISILIPKWVAEVPEHVNTKETNILLPLRNEVRNEIHGYIGQIHASLLLFLPKLRVIEIEDKVLGKSEEITSRDYNGTTEIKQGPKESRWRTERKHVRVPDSVEESRRKDIHETEIVLAFPVKGDGSAETDQEQDVFAFLPIRKYGFKFIVQADFLLPVGREDIVKDSPWNRLLRDSITSVFLDAIERFKTDEKIKYTFFNYIPVGNEVSDDFFVPVVKQIHEELQNTECLLTESIQWRKPPGVLMADDEIRELISNEDLRGFLNKEYISEKIDVAKDVLRKLKVDEFSVDQLLEYLKNPEWTKKQDDEWFVRLYMYLSRQELTQDQFSLMRNLDILRLENGELVSTVDGPIFLPLSRQGKNYGFETELRVIKRSIWKLIKTQERKNKDSIIELFKKLGLRSPQPYEIIENHILPPYENDDWKKKDSAVLLGYTKYIKDNLEEYEKESDKRLNGEKRPWERKEDPLKRLKTSLFIRILKEDKWYAHPVFIYLPQIYGNTHDLETLFQGIEVNFLHPCYIESILREHERRVIASREPADPREIEERIRKASKTRDEKIKRWWNFFLKLGVSDLLIVRKDPQTGMYEGDSYANSKVTGKQISRSGKEASIWKDCEWEDTDWRGYYISDDWVSEDFDKIVQKLGELPEDLKISLSNRLLSLLDRNWNKYRGYKSCRYYYRYSGHQGWNSKETPSTFLLNLKRCAWCPTNRHLFAKPSQIFLDKQEVREVLGDSVSYLALEVKNEDFIKDLGFNVDPNVEGVLNYLKGLVEQGCNEKDRIEKAYSFLSSKFDGDAKGIIEAFSNCKLIYIPNTARLFFTIQEVFWKDVSDVFGENRAYLEKHYPKLKYFFVEKLRVAEKPSPKDYADVLADVAGKGKIEEKDKHLVLKVYEELNYHLDSTNVEKTLSEENWWAEFVRKAIFLTDKDEFWCNEKDVFIKDNKELYELFKEEQNLAFLSLPEGYHPDKIKFFTEASGIRCLSEAIQVTPIFDESKCSENEELTRQIQNLTPYIIRYLYWKENSKYEGLKANGFLGDFSNLRVYTVDKLQAKFTINIREDKYVSTTVERICIPFRNKLYVSRVIGDNTDFIAVELSKIFGQIRGLDSFIVSIYERPSVRKTEELLALMNVEALPKSESGLLEKLASKAPQVEEIQAAPQVIQPSPTSETKGELAESKLLSDLEVGKTTETQAPEHPAEQAKVSSDGYMSEGASTQSATEEASTLSTEPIARELEKLLETETIQKPTLEPPSPEAEEISAPEVSVDMNREELAREINGMKQLLTKHNPPVPPKNDLWRSPTEIDKVTSEPKIVVRTFVSASSKKNWKLQTLDGEKVYVETELDQREIDAVNPSIKAFRERMRKIISTMGGNPDTVNICIAHLETDGDRREGQLFFNVLRNDKPLRWIVVAARELAYVKFPKPSQAHISLMTDLISKALENIEEIYPEIFGK